MINKCNGLDDDLRPSWGEYQEEEGLGIVSARDYTDRSRQQQQQQESRGETPGGISWRPEQPSPPQASG